MALQSNSWNRYYTSQAHSSINSGYNNAISHYSQQKRSFLKNLELNSNITIQNFMDNLNREIDQEIESELDNTFLEAFSKVAEKIETMFVTGLQTGTLTGYQELLNSFSSLINKQSQGKVDPNREYENMKKHIETFLALNNIDKSGLAQYALSSSKLGSRGNTDIQNNLFGYARRVMLAQLQGKGFNYKTQNFKNSLKGYYKEELLTSVLEKVLSKYGYKIQQMGSEVNEKGQQIQIDIGIFKANMNNPLDGLINSLSKLGSESAESTLNTRNANLIGGIQSKSWVAPWSSKSYGKNTGWLSLGSHANLMPQGHSAYYWHAGVNNVMRNLIEVIGPENFIFATGDQVYFTSDMLIKFREAQYVFAFYKRKEGKIESPGVGGQPHLDA